MISDPYLQSLLNNESPCSDIASITIAGSVVETRVRTYVETRCDFGLAGFSFLHLTKLYGRLPDAPKDITDALNLIRQTRNLIHFPEKIETTMDAEVMEVFVKAVNTVLYEISHTQNT